MTTRRCAFAGLALALAATALAGCERPDWLTRLDPLPPLPVWAQPLKGRLLEEAFRIAPTDACTGNTEQVETRYEGGAKVMGWGWDALGKAPVARVVATGPDRRIAGAGESGLDRVDVPQALPQVTSDKTGWWALTASGSGPVEMWGVMADGRVCPLGRITP